jgi:hypothetical protein
MILLHVDEDAVKVMADIPELDFIAKYQAVQSPRLSLKRGNSSREAFHDIVACNLARRIGDNVVTSSFEQRASPSADRTTLNVCCIVEAVCLSP